MYKIVYKLVPDTLCSLLKSASIRDTPIRTTRQQFDLPHFRARTDLFDNTFFPSTIRLWNQLPLDVRNSTSIYSFKSKITHYPIRPIKYPELYNIGNRVLSIHHTRLRLDASQLNSHLFKIGVKDSPRCSCGSHREDPWHYFFSCPLYAAPRSTLHAKISAIAPFTLHTVLFGSVECSLEHNTSIFLAVQEYILKTRRFGASGIG